MNNICKQLWVASTGTATIMLLTSALAFGQGSGGGGSNTGGGGSNSGGGSNASNGSASGDGFSRRGGDTKGRGPDLGGLSRATNNSSSRRSPTFRTSSDRDDRIRAYIQDNYARIEEEAARGGGEYLSQLAVVADIPEQYKSDFYAALKRDYQLIFQDSQSEKAVENQLVKYCDRYRRGIGVSAKEPNKPNPAPTAGDVQSVNF